MSENIPPPLQGTQVEENPEKFSALLKAVSRRPRYYSTVPYKPKEDFPWYLDVLHGIGKTEEYKAKALGKLLTDNPRYKNIFGESDWSTQVTYAELMGDLGLNQENLGTFGPLAATVVGVGLALADPTEWLNKLKIFGLTRKGVVGKTLATTGTKALKQVGKKGAKFWQFDPKKIVKSIKEKEATLAKGGLTGKNQKNLYQSVKRLKQSLAEMDELNPIFKELQLTHGLSLDDIKLAPSMYERSVSGQARLLGFSSIFRPDQLALLGMGRSDMAGSVRLGLPKAMDAALVSGGGKALKFASTPITQGFRMAMRGIGYPLIETEEAKEVAKNILRIFNEFQGKPVEFERELQSILTRSGLTDDQIHMIREHLEATASPDRVRLFMDSVEQLKRQNPDIFSFKSAQKIRLAREAEAKKLALKSQLTKEEELLLTPSGLLPEDIDRAMNEFNNSKYEELPIGDAGHGGRILGEYIVLRANSGKARTGQLTELDDVYGQKVWARYPAKGTTEDGNVFLVQRRLPGAARIGTVYSKADGKAFLEAQIPILEAEEAAGTRARAAAYPKLDEPIKVAEPKKGPPITKEEREALEQILPSPTPHHVVGKPRNIEFVIREHVPKARKTAKGAKEANEFIENITSIEQARIDLPDLAITNPDAAALVEKQLAKGRIQLVGRSKRTKKVTEVIHELDEKGYAHVRGGDFTETHLENLEQIAAQLATRGRMLVDLKPSDVLVTPFGGVQIINPDVIAKAKATKKASARDRAVANSMQALDRFADEVGISMGPAREFHFLKNAEAAGRAPGLRFKRIAVEGDEEGVLYANAYALVEDSAGMGPIRDFLRAGAEGISPEELALGMGDLRDFARANNIEQWRQHIRRQIAAGVDAEFPPIQVNVDLHGQQWIVDGHDRLAAAIMEGFDAVPISKVDAFGEAFTGKFGYYVGKTIRLDDVFKSVGNEAKVGFPGGLEEGGKLSGADHISPDYKLTSSSGVSVGIPTDSLDVPSAGRMMMAVLDFITQGPAMTERTIGVRHASFIQRLEREYETLADAAVTLSEMIEDSRDYIDFSQKLEKMVGLNLANTRDVTIAKKMRGFFDEAVRSTAKEHLDELAGKGVLTHTTVLDPARQRMAAQGTHMTVEVLDGEKNAIRLISTTRGSNDLHGQAKGMLEQAGGAESIEPYAKVITQGQSGEEVVKEVRDFVERPHPSLRDAVVPERALKFSEKRAQELADQGKLINPTREELKEVGFDFGVLLGRAVNEAGDVSFSRPTYAYIVTRTGDIIVDTRNEDVSVLLNQLFGEGPQYVQEFGVITAGRVTVSNPLGIFMEQIGQAEINVLKRRLQLLAKRFADMGIDYGTTFDVLAPFDLAVWERIYGSRTSIGEVLDPKFKLRVPELIKGHIPDAKLQQSHFLSGEEGEVAYSVRQPRIHDPKVAKIVQFLKDANDEMFYQLGLNNIPINYLDGYFSRNLDPQAAKILNEQAFKWIEEKARVQKLKHLETFFKSRVFTDFTTREINDIIREARKLGVDAEDLPTQIIDMVLQQYNKTLDINDARKFGELAKILPSGVDLFILDPFIAQALRFRGQQTAIARKQIVDQLDRAGIWSGTPKELRDARAGKEPFEQVEAKIRKTQERLAEAEKNLADFKAGKGELKDTTEEMLIQRVSQHNDELARLQADKANKLKSFTKAQSAQAWTVDLKANRVWITGEDATRLAREGVIKLDDVIGDVGDVLVQVPFARYETDLDNLGMKVMLLPPEMEAVAQRYFSTMRKDGFNRFLQFFDNAQGLWRTWTLFPIPAYHGRNVLSNVFLAWLGGITNLRVYRDSFKLFNILRQHRNGKMTLDEAKEMMRSVVFSTAGGEVKNLEEIYAEFIRAGGMQGGIHINEYGNFGTAKRATEFERKAVDLGIAPSRYLAGNFLTDNWALRKGLSAASFIDNHFRFAAFLHTWEMTGDFAQAERAVKTIFYDYRDLTLFERDWARRLLPFYSWSRHNIPRMLQTLVTKPAVHYRVSELVKTLEFGANNGQPVSEAELPDWVREQFGIVIAKDKQGHYMVKTAEGFLPMVDAYKVIGYDALLTMFKNGLTPFVKVPMESISNMDFYRSKLFGRPEEQKEIEEYPGQRARSFTLGSLGFTRRPTIYGPGGTLNILLNEHLFRNFVRIGQEGLSRLIDPWIDYWLNEDNYRKEKPSIPVTMLALAIGRSYSIDPAMTRAVRARRWRRDIKKYEDMRVWAMKQGRLKDVADLDSLINFERLNQPPQ